MFRTFRNKLLAALLSALLAAAPCAAQERIIGGGVFGGAATYQGPGDIVSGATAWFGLRAYNAAYATGLNKAVNVRRASDNTTQDINVTATGALNIASANTFAGTDATCTGTISSTTLTCASASSTPHAGSTLTGAGITQPSFIVSCGTFTGGAGTCTLNAAQTVSVGETITMQYGLYVTTAYDQTGNGINVAQATAGNQPQLLPNCGRTSGGPCLTFPGTASHCLIGTATYTSTVSWSAESVVNYNSLSAAMAITAFNTAFQNEMGGGNTAGDIEIDTGNTFLSQAGTTATWYAQSGAGTGTTNAAIISANGTSTTGTTANVTATEAAAWGCRTNGAAAANAFSSEAGQWGSLAFTSTQIANLTSNARTFWGF